MPSTALAVKRALYRRDYVSNQYQARINKIYERPSKLSILSILSAEGRYVYLQEWNIPSQGIPLAIGPLPTAFLPTS